MNFEEAYDRAFDKTPKGSIPKEKNLGSGLQFARILALMWSILAEAQDKNGKIVLDNIAHVDENANIVSVPIEKKVEKTVKAVEEGETPTEKPKKDTKKVKKTAKTVKKDKVKEDNAPEGTTKET